MNTPQSTPTPIYLPTLLARQGGAWLAAARTWMQTRFKNGSDVTWGTNDLLTGAPVTVADIEEVASRAAAAALNDPPSDYPSAKKLAENVAELVATLKYLEFEANSYVEIGWDLDDESKDLQAAMLRARVVIAKMEKGKTSRH